MSLISELRSRITDVRYSQRAFGLAVTDPAATTAIAEITDGHLIVTTAGGVTGVDLDFRHPMFDTVEKIYRALDRTPGYRVSADEDWSPDHSSLDLQPFGPTNILSTGVDLTHRIFSDVELVVQLDSAVKRHNPGFSLHTVPPGEETFVLALAHANVCRVIAMDASKRKGMDSEIFYLIELANSLERTYDKDTKRLKRALQSPKEASSNDMGEGDIVIGSYSRFNMRTGRMTPSAANAPPMPAELLPLDDSDIEDEQVLVRWKRNRDTDFYGFEVWMNHKPEVERIGNRSTDSLSDVSDSRMGTSKKVFASQGTTVQASFRNSRIMMGGSGQAVTSYPIPGLEPSTTYYFRCYIIDANGEASASEVEEVTTKALRSKFLTPSALDVARGPAGTVLTISLDPNKAAITTACKITIGVKEVTPTIISPYLFSVVTPSFVVKGAKDVCIVSPNGLQDVLVDGFEVT